METEDVGLDVGLEEMCTHGGLHGGEAQGLLCPWPPKKLKAHVKKNLIEGLLL